MAEAQGIVVNPTIKDVKIEGNMVFNVNLGQSQALKKANLQKCVTSLKSFLKSNPKNLVSTCGEKVSNIYTDLLITVVKGQGWLDSHHEMFSNEYQRLEGVEIQLKDIFSTLPNEQDPLQKVLMKGIAGSGKSVAVQKFTYDWANGETNKNLQLLFPFSFRELNHLEKKELSLKNLIDEFYVQVKDLSPEDYEEAEVLFVFDGLDESRFPVKFNIREPCCSMEKKTTIGVLISSLLSGQLLHRSKIWVTSRPTAACKIKDQLFDRVTHLQGFSEDQISEYICKTIKDVTLAGKILDHLRSKILQNLMVMCRIPLFCWLSATSLKSILTRSKDVPLPKTMTEMYIHFLIYLVNKNKMGPGSTNDFVLNLGKLAYNQLKEENINFKEEDLTEAGINLDDGDQGTVVSGFCIQILQKTCGLYEKTTYSFIHLTVQEFLAALYVLESFVSSGTSLVQAPEQKKKQRGKEILSVHQNSVEMALRSPNGHWDLFLRFLFGLSEEQNQELLEKVLGMKKKVGLDKVKTIIYIKETIHKSTAKDRTVNLFHCLSELGDRSLIDEVQQHFSTGKVEKISPIHWSALAYLILVSNDDMETFDLKKYFRSDETLQRLQTVLNASRTADLENCNLTGQGCKCVSAVLSMSGSNLEEVNMSNNPLGNIGVKVICEGFRSKHCKLKTLRLANCELNDGECLSTALKSATLTQLDLSLNHLQDDGVRLMLAGLESSPTQTPKILRLVSCGISANGCKSLSWALKSTLKELDLSHNNLKDSVAILHEGLMDPSCKLEKLRLSSCQLTNTSCESLSSCMSSLALVQLDLSDNEFHDSGVHWLSGGLKSPNCKLESLRLSGCMISKAGCVSLAKALESNSKFLKELDLSFNHPGDVAITLHAAGPEDPGLKKDHCGPHRIRQGPRKYWCHVSLDINTAKQQLKISPDKLKATSSRERQQYVPHNDRFSRWCQVLGQRELKGQCYWEVNWEGDVEVAVTYKGIKRMGEKKDSHLGRNSVSWSLRCGRDRMQFSVFHNNIETKTHCDSEMSRVAVHLDWDAGKLSYYGVSGDTLAHIYTFNCAFTEPVLPGFWVSSNGSDVSVVPGPKISDLKG